MSFYGGRLGFPWARATGEDFASALPISLDNQSVQRVVTVRLVVALQCCADSERTN